MKRLLAMICMLAMLATMLPASVLAASAAQSVDFVVLSTTDMHGKCWDVNVLTDGTETNNMLRVSTAVKSYRANYGENMLLIDNGDLYQGTPVSVVQLGKITSGESDLPAAMALCLSEIGYDVSVLGNHEFNYPWTTMSGIYEYLAAQGIPVVTANLYYDGTDGVHARGENVFTPYVIKTVSIGGNEHKIGILGFENTDCTRWDVPTNYPGIVFAHPDNTELSMAWEAQRYIPQMQAEGCEFIIVSYHAGTGAATGTLTFGLNTEDQLTRMIAECEGIDLVIAGHDHSSAYSNTYLPDKNGDSVLVVNGGGKDLTQSVFTFSEDAEGALQYTVKDTRNLSLAAYAVDTELKAKLQPYADMAIAYVNQPAGTAVGTWDTSSNYYLQQTDTMDLINAAQIDFGTEYMALKYNTEEKREALYAATGLDHIDVDMSSTSAVTNNNYYVRPGDITMRTICQMYRYDNNVLYLLPLTGQQIKDILEQNAATRLKAIVKNGKVTFSTIGEDFTNPVFGGLNFTYDMYQPEGSRVIIEGFSNGREFALDRTYIVACNSYHLGNTGCGFGAYSPTDSIWNQNDDLAGGNVQEVLLAYIQKYGEITTEPFTWHWKLDYTGDLDAPTVLTGDLVAQATDTLADGDRIVIYYDAEATVVGSDPAENVNRLAAVGTTAYKDYIAFSDKAAVFTVELLEGENHPFLLKAEQGYLTAGPTGNSLAFAAEATDCSAWYLVPVEGGFHIMNVGANYNGNYNQALEWYTGFTTYGVKDTSAYLFNLCKLVDAGKLASELTDGGRYVIYFDQDEYCVGAEALSGGLAPVKNEISGSFLLPPPAEGTLVVTAKIDGEGRIDFVSEDGRHLTSNLAGNGLQLTDEPDGNGCSLWTLVPVEGGWHVMNVGANYNGNYNQALEFYNGKFTTYGVKDTGAYLFNFYELAGSELPQTLSVALITDGAPAKDGGFNQAVYDAASAWCEVNGATFGAYVPEEIGDFEYDCSGAVEAAINDGCTVLLMPGYSMAAPAVDNATKYPDVRFILFDVSEYDLQDAAEDENFEIPANIYAATYREEQAGYLAGWAAVSLGYSKLGFLGGMAIPAVMRYGYGFVQGVNAAAAAQGKTGEVSIDYVYCDQFWPDDTLTEFIEGWYENGTEVVFACGGGIYTSVAEAAQRQGGKIIGVDIDQGVELDAEYGAGFTVTSAIKGLGAMAAAQLDRILAGTFDGGVAENLGVVSDDPAQNYVGIAPTTQFGEGFTAEDYSALLGQLVSGALTVSDDVDNRPETEIEVRYRCYPACDWAEPTYEWAEDNSTVTAKRVCINDEGHIETETVEVLYERIEPTCEADGTVVYLAEFENPAFENQIKTETLAALGHAWSDPTYEWAEDYSTVTATRVCANDDSHVETEIAETWSEILTPADYGVEGELIYTAEFVNPAFETQTASAVIPALEIPFLDIDPTDYFFNPVLWAVENGITTGTSANTFSPASPCTRAQVVTFLWRAAGSPEPTQTDNPFTDVASDAYYFKAVLWAVEKHITNGTSKTTFSPGSTCTRGQIVTFLWRSQGVPAASTAENPFTDVASNQYYYKAVLWAAENGITTGTSATTFSPGNTCTRGQVVTFLYRTALLQRTQPQIPEAPSEKDMDLVEYIIDYRVGEGKSELSYDDASFQVAQCRVADLLISDQDDRPNGEPFWNIFEDLGIPYAHVGQLYWRVDKSNVPVETFFNLIKNNDYCYQMITSSWAHRLAVCAVSYSPEEVGGEGCTIFVVIFKD